MKTLTQKFQEILKRNKVEAPFPEGARLLIDLIEAVNERDEELERTREKDHCGFCNGKMECEGA